MYMLYFHYQENSVGEGIKQRHYFEIDGAQNRIFIGIHGGAHPFMGKKNAQRLALSSGVSILSSEAQATKN
jgi:hypothetical protein